MASELTVIILRFAFLALLWFFVFLVLAAARRDLGLGKNFRTVSVDAFASPALPAAEQAPVAAPPARPSQLVITEGAQAGAMIGRANDIEVSLQDDYASGRHARLFPQGSRWFLEDLGSTNGTYVDGQRLSRATVIEPGTEFRVGGTTMQLRGSSVKIAFRFAARSDVGVRRSKNDDSGYGGRYLAVVADGMGGHVGGDVASATAVLNLTPLDHPDFDGTAGVYLADEIQSANSIINDLAHEDSRLAGMGTTCTALLIDGDKIELAHIGDSRAYRLRPGPDGQFEQISTDHTFVQRLLNEGRITPQEAVHHPHRNVIMRVLGDVDASPELELQTLDAVPGERWVLASDGLDSVVPDSDIEAVLRSTDDLEQIADVLIQMTLERGAPDNVTVVVAQVIDRSVLPEDEPVG